MDDNQRYPVSLIAFACVTTYILGNLRGAEMLITAGGIYPPAILAGQYGRLLTAIFIHLNLTHLLCNMSALIVFGGYVADEYGGGRFLKVFLITGIFSSLGVLFFGDTNTITVGASGALYGVEFYLFTQLLLKRKTDFSSLMPLFVWIVISNFIPGISVVGHVSGLVAGVVLGFIDYGYDFMKREIRMARWRAKGIPEKTTKSMGQRVSKVFMLICVGLAAFVALAYGVAYLSPKIADLKDLFVDSPVVQSVVGNSTGSEGYQPDMKGKYPVAGSKQATTQDDNGSKGEQSSGKLTKEQLEVKLAELPVVVTDFKFVEMTEPEGYSFLNTYFQITFENRSKDDILDIAFMVMEWDEKGVPVSSEVGTELIYYKYVSKVTKLEINTLAGEVGVLNTQYFHDIPTGHTYKVFVIEYTTYGGGSWRNPYIEDIATLYYWQKYTQ